jgi:hypothetical protein
MTEILHFCPSKSFSGLEQYALELAWDQKKKGRKVAFVVHPDSELRRECEKLRAFSFIWSRAFQKNISSQTQDHFTVTYLDQS